MTRTMYDSVTPSRIPASATMVAGYADGHYANLTEMRARFPHAVVVSIAVSPHTRAHVLDVEPGDATPHTAVTWCTTTMHDVPNNELTIYCNASTMPAVKAAFKTAGVSLPQFWVADWDGHAEVPAGAVAKQHTNRPGYDISAVADHWPGVDPKTPAVDSPTPAKPTVDLSRLIAAARTDPHAPQGHQTYPTGVHLVEAALRAEGLLPAKYAGDGSYGTKTIAAYAAWQRHLGYHGADADGIPGRASLTKLGAKHGFTVTP